MKRNIYTIMFAAIFGAVCAALLTTLAEFTKERCRANAQAHRARSILEALDVEFDADATSEEVLRAFDKNVAPYELGDLDAYAYTDPSGVRTIAVRFSGPGLWGPIEGVLALEAGLDKIRGINFYQHDETPGLGAQIDEKYFQRRFVGRSLTDAVGRAGIEILRVGEPDADNEIEGISGATLTCNKVETMLNEVIERIVEIRRGRGG